MGVANAPALPIGPVMPWAATLAARRSLVKGLLLLATVYSAHQKFADDELLILLLDAYGFTLAKGHDTCAKVAAVSSRIVRSAVPKDLPLNHK